MASAMRPARYCSVYSDRPAMRKRSAVTAITAQASTTATMLTNLVIALALPPHSPKSLLHRHEQNGDSRNGSMACHPVRLAARLRRRVDKDAQTLGPQHIMRCDRAVPTRSCATFARSSHCHAARVGTARFQRHHALKRRVTRLCPPYEVKRAAAG